jgi:spoIIIJ-associated protein
MTDYIRVEGKTVEDAVNEAMVRLECSTEEMEYNILDEGSKGFLGLGSKPAIIEARKKETEEERLMAAATGFLTSVFETLKIDVKLEVSFNEEEKTIEINMIGEDMGNLIGKRGQTLDSLQYLTSLVVNKNHDDYIRVKLDTENYRERRKETLESLAKNIAFKVKRTKRPVKLEPMNPYERRIIHSALQSDKYVYTKSEGEEPYRHVVVMLKRERRYQDNRQNA